MSNAAPKRNRARVSAVAGGQQQQEKQRQEKQQQQEQEQESSGVRELASCDWCPDPNQ